MTTPLQVAAVVLDLDDTLIREHDFVVSGYTAVADMLTPILGTGADELRARLLGIFDSPDRPRAFNALLAPFDREDLVGACVERYRSHPPDIALTPAAQTVLDELVGRVPVGVVTDGPEVMQEAKVRALGLRERGLEVVCTDSLGGRATWKPSPEGLLEVLRRVGVAPQDAVYVADNPHKDFLATARAGMASIRLRQEGQLHAACEPEDTARPDLEVHDLREVLPLLTLPHAGDR